MPINWGELLRIIIPSAAGVTGAVLGNRAQGQALEVSREELEAARERASNYLLEALKGAVPYADWARDQAHAGYDAGYGRAAAYLDPYAAGGQQAFSRLSSMAGSTPRISDYRGSGLGARGSNLQPTAASFRSNPVPRTPYPGTEPPAFQVPGGARNTLAGLMGGPSGFDLSNNFVPSSRAPTFGGIAGAGLGAAIGAGAGAGAGTLVMPGVGTAVGALVGGLIGRLTRAGREREAATEAAKEFANWWWNDIMPQGRAGKITKADLQAALEAGWGQYSNWLDQNIKDSDVNRNSRTSQRAWLDEGLNGPNGWASIPGGA